MTKRRQLKDAASDPMVAPRQSYQKSLDKKSSPSLQKIVISLLSVLVVAVAGILFNRYLKII